MKFVCLLVMACAAASSAPLKVGEFRAEVQHTFGTSNGLPSNDVRCVAAAGARVWAGTTQGIAVREAGAWRVVDRRAVDACASWGSGVGWVSAGEVYR